MNPQNSSRKCQKWLKNGQIPVNFKKTWPKFGKKPSIVYTAYVHCIYNSHTLAYSPDNNDNNKRGFSAKGLSLLPLALRPRLFRFRSIKVGVLPVIAAFSLLYIVNVSVSNVSAASITLTIPKTLSLNVNPAANNGFAKSEAPGTITVTTDNSVGYTLNIKAKNESNDLLNGENKIVSISNNLSESDFKSSSQANIWGFLPSKLYNTESGTSQDNSNFIPGPKSNEDTTIDVTDSANTDPNSYNISLGAKVDSTIPAGSYSNTFVISASANVIPYDDIMQDWDGCSDLGDDQTIRLLDNRDGNVYTVAKLKDGKCWMTDNLRLGDSKLTAKNPDRKLTSADTDITGTYSLPASNETGFDDNTKGFVFVPESDFSKNNYNVKKEYGGYYSWIAATAGYGIIAGYAGLQAPGSICPKGWSLPTGGSGGEFSALTKAYGGSGSYENNTTLRDALIAKPIPNFVYSGYYNDSSPTYQGSSGVWWSSTASAFPNVYDLYLRSDGNVYPLDNLNRHYGFAVRCIAQEPEPEPVTDLLTSVYTSTTDNIEFTAGDGIELLIVGDNRATQKPYYAFPDTNVSFSSANGKSYILTVVPKSGYILDGSVGALKTGDKTVISAKGKTGTYTSMQDFNSCTEAGTNVTDTRDGKSYTVAKVGNKCYMLSNLRLAAGTALNTSTSAISSNFTLPDKATSDAWTSSSQDWFGKASMKECHGIAGNGSTNSKCAEASNNITEYYYNWYAATANPSNPSNPTSFSSANDNASLGSICPRNWSLPPDQDADINTTNTGAAYLGANRARFMTSGYFYSGSQITVGSCGFWWSSTRENNFNAYYLRLNSGDVDSSNFDKYRGFSVRCMRNSGGSDPK